MMAPNMRTPISTGQRNRVRHPGLALIGAVTSITNKNPSQESTINNSRENAPTAASKMTAPTITAV